MEKVTCSVHVVVQARKIITSLSSDSGSIKLAMSGAGSKPPDARVLSVMSQKQKFVRHYLHYGCFIMSVQTGRPAYRLIDVVSPGRMTSDHQQAQQLMNAVL